MGFTITGNFMPPMLFSTSSVLGKLINTEH